MQADETQAINQLQSEQSRLLDKIDELRTIGVGGFVELPQLVVVGAQSSGKSSVLEAVSRVSFPTKSNVCTRFATEVVLRRSPTVRMKVLVEPGASRTNAEERQKIRDFTPDSFSNTSDLPNLIDQAKERMGITNNMHGFSDDVLKVEISGPDKPELTLVDLPGLYISESKEQGAEGIRIVRELTERYMENNRSIILAVISAKVDYHLQNVLNIAKHFDPKRERTMGIITQPDRLERDSEEEENYIRYARNEKVPLNLGWHVLKNRSYENRMASHDVRDEQERAFLDQGRWASLSREFVGVDSLRRRLSKVLLKHVRRNLPDLIVDIQRQIEVRQKHLERLGPARSSAQEQRGYLLAICSKFERIVGQALNGMYEDEFFRTFNSLESDSDKSQDFRRLRAITRELNECFAEAMEIRGHRRCIVGTTHDAPTADSKVLSQPYMEGWTPIKISREKLESEVSEQAKWDRGIEMPGSANQLLVGSLFRDQSQPWEMLARQHLLQCWESVKYFVGLILQYLTDEHTHSLLYRAVLLPDLERMKAHLMEKLNELTSHTKRGHPLPVGSGFLARIQKARTKRQLSSLRGSILGWNSKNGDDKLTIDDLTRAVSAMDLSKDQFAAADIIDQMQAYYDTAIITFVDNIATLAVENCLLAPLERIFTNQTVNTMDENQLKDLAAEPPFVREDRRRLTGELGKLQAGLQTFSVLGTEPPSMSRPPAFPSRPPSTSLTFKPNCTFTTAHEEHGHPSTTGTTEPSSVTRTPSPDAKDSRLSSTSFLGAGAAGKNSNTTSLSGQSKKGDFGAWSAAKENRLGGQSNASNENLSSAASSSSETSSLSDSSASSGFGLSSAGKGTPKTREPVSSRPPKHKKNASPSSPFDGFGSKPSSGSFGASSSKRRNRSTSVASPLSLTPCIGSRYFDYRPFAEKDKHSGSTDCYHSICKTPLYENFSFEEIRLADYQAGHRFATVS